LEKHFKFLTLSYHDYHERLLTFLFCSKETLAVGDTMGQVTIWDIRMGTLLQVTFGCAENPSLWDKGMQA